VRTARTALVQVSGRHLRSRHSSVFCYIAIVSLPIALTGDNTGLASCKDHFRKKGRLTTSVFRVISACMVYDFFLSLASYLVQAMLVVLIKVYLLLSFLGTCENLSDLR
jgi:hypothetical protein